jgi:aminoglycoside phosphotransferase family enzyme
MEAGRLPEGRKVEKLITTHISWVLLTEDRVYKIKKPLKLSFLDFSSVERRKHFAEEELRLNQRLCKEVYLSVLPILEGSGGLHIGQGVGTIVGYALEMKRLDNSREMDVLLAKGEVGEEDMDRMLKVLVPFHQNAEVVQGKVNAKALFEDFADIEQILEFCNETLGIEAGQKLMDSIAMVKEFLEKHSELILHRDAEGFTRDGHGDLHSGNIFLLEKPMLFDCIEFNPHFRQIDILNELAFFTMDLEFAGRKDLSEYFIQGYNRVFPVMRNIEEEALYLFYKLYRANVRVKVNAIQCQGAESEEERQEHLALFKAYFQLYKSYCSSLFA